MKGRIRKKLTDKMTWYKPRDDDEEEDEKKKGEIRVGKPAPGREKKRKARIAAQNTEEE